MQQEKALGVGLRRGRGVGRGGAYAQDPGAWGAGLRLSVAGGSPRVPLASGCRGSGLGPQQAH